MNKYIVINSYAYDKDVKSILTDVTNSVMKLLTNRYSDISVSTEISDKIVTLTVDDTSNILEYECYGIEDELVDIINNVENVEIRRSIGIYCFDWNDKEMEGQIDYMYSIYNGDVKCLTFSVGSDNDFELKTEVLAGILHIPSLPERLVKLFSKYEVELHKNYKNVKYTELDKVKKDLENKVDVLLEEIADIKNILYNLENKIDMIR